MGREDQWENMEYNEVDRICIIVFQLQQPLSQVSPHTNISLCSQDVKAYARLGPGHIGPLPKNEKQGIFQL